MPRRCGGRPKLSRAFCERTAVLSEKNCVLDSEDRTANKYAECEVATGCSNVATEIRSYDAILNCKVKLDAFSRLSLWTSKRVDGERETDMQKHNGTEYRDCANQRSKQPGCWVACGYAECNAHNTECFRRAVPPEGVGVLQKSDAWLRQTSAGLNARNYVHWARMGLEVKWGWLVWGMRTLKE
ncbi:hypothetical protein J1614_008476 [Plenodomus biglobosus]|nr:hypothetical protein J1614_008476 [Plenodomus biglobosus]